VILSDHTLREELARGRIVVEPFDERCLQPSSIDVKLSPHFRVFRNHTAGIIDVKAAVDLTEPVEIPDDGVFMLHPGEFVLGSTLERIAVPDDMVSRIDGKALSVDTEIPTPHGFVRMGDLRVGDDVFTDCGTPVRIKDATEVLLGRPCYEITFSDHTTVVADAGHLWWTTTKRERWGRKRGELRTTAELAASVMHGAGHNHQVPLSAPMLTPWRELPVDPYVFGIWLGDGTSTKAEVTTIDGQVLDEIGEARDAVWPASGPLSYRIGGTHRRSNARTGRFEADESLNSTLRLMGQFGNKHLPRSYMEGAHGQRLALLQGLMDSDGSIDRLGRAEFCSTKEHLAVGVRELVASLGMVARLCVGRARLNGVDCGPRYRVLFTPDRPVFRLQRKLDRVKYSNRTMLARSIRSVRPVPSVPVRCIEVDSPRGMYVATRSFIPTHNSSLGRLGLIIHSTAGFIDPGFDGHITLELTNIATLPITLYPAMKVGQVSFMRMTTSADNPYGKGATGSKYQGQRGPTPSRYFENFRDDG
jgi:deoxycytidine triphosphate deaminase